LDPSLGRSSTLWSSSLAVHVGARSSDSRGTRCGGGGGDGGAHHGAAMGDAKSVVALVSHRFERNLKPRRHAAGWRHHYQPIGFAEHLCRARLRTVRARAGRVGFASMLRCRGWLHPLALYVADVCTCLFRVAARAKRVRRVKWAYHRRVALNLTRSTCATLASLRGHRAWGQAGASGNEVLRFSRPCSGRNVP